MLYDAGCLYYITSIILNLRLLLTLLIVTGEAKLGTSEEVFNKIFSHESFEQLKLVFEAYKKISGRTIEQALKSEMSGVLLEAMLAIGNIIFIFFPL
jgi:hypothetical protein